MELGDSTAGALFLDLDGTLIEIASTPHGVTIPHDLRPSLERLAGRIGGALAIVTGRPIADLDCFIAPFAPVAAGIHGAELRLTPGGEARLQVEPIDSRVVENVRDLVGGHPEIIIETKRASIAVHYRQAPLLGPRLEAALARLLDDGPDHVILARGRQVLEIVPRHVSKGTALETIMELPAFRGRRPIMIGDDVSDLSAFQAAGRLGGIGLKVAGEQFSPSEADFAGPAEVRSWLKAQADRLAP